MALLVTEPTLSGIHDLERVLGVCAHFGVQTAVCINKWNINDDNTRQIEAYCDTQGVDVVAKIPFDNVFTEAIVRGIPVVNYTDSAVVEQLRSLWHSVAEKFINN